MIISVKEIKKFVCSILIPLLLGYLSNTIAQLLNGLDIGTYYQSLIKPSFAPPGIIFPIVWSILFILMGTSSYIMMSHNREQIKVRDAMFYYWIQLGLNFIWTILFFGLNLRLTALIDLILLIVIVSVMVYKFYKIEPKAAYLNIPYLIWLFYALVLNYFIWFMNK